MRHAIDVSSFVAHTRSRMDALVRPRGPRVRSRAACSPMKNKVRVRLTRKTTSLPAHILTGVRLFAVRGPEDQLAAL